MQYSINDFIDVVLREQQKRLVTYPKILDKCEDMRDTHHLRQAQEEQNIRLAKVLEVLNTFYEIAALSNVCHSTGYLDEGKELLREYNCRMRFYPLMIMRHKIKKEVAEEEKAVWKALLELWFEPTQHELKFLKTKAKLIVYEEV